MSESAEKKRLAILRVLRKARGPVSSARITEILAAKGYDLSDRTVRFHLQATDEAGLTYYIGKQGRKITPRGLAELESSRVFEKVGFLAAAIDQMTWLMDFDPVSRGGTLIVNVSLLPESEAVKAAEMMIPAFEKALAMGEMVTLFPAGSLVGGVIIPENYIGLGTVCSFTLNGILIKAGIPTRSLFGGLLEVEGYRPSRFVEIINYDGTSIDPLEIFLKSGMTSLNRVLRNGNGRIGANFLEFPEEARNSVAEIEERLQGIHLGNIAEIGAPEHPLLEIPINVGRVGAIARGGLNPLAVLHENRMDVISHAASDVLEYDLLFHYSELLKRLRQLLSA